MSTLDRIFAPHRPLVWGLTLAAIPGIPPRGIIYSARHMGAVASGVL